MNSIMFTVLYWQRKCKVVWWQRLLWCSSLSLLNSVSVAKCFKHKSIVIFHSAFSTKILGGWERKRRLGLSVLWDFLMWSTLGASLGVLGKWSQYRKIDYPVTNCPLYFNFSREKLDLPWHINRATLSGTVDWFMRFCSNILALLVFSLCNFGCVTQTTQTNI